MLIKSKLPKVGHDQRGRDVTLHIVFEALRAIILRSDLKLSKRVRKVMVKTLRFHYKANNLDYLWLLYSGVKPVKSMLRTKTYLKLKEV